MMRSISLALAVLLSLSARAQTTSDSLTSLLDSMIEQYDALSTENVQLATEMDIQRTQIDSLRTALHRGDDLNKARKEAKVLRSIMTGYVVTIDSLNKSNQNLQRRLDE